MPLAEANQQSQPVHPSWMPLAKAHQSFVSVIHADAISLS